MSTLVIMRGLPGCGKSTYAREWVGQDPDGRAEVNRDAIRLMLGGFVVGSSAQEKMVTTVSHNAIRDLLNAGTDVICSDTNIPMKYMRDLWKIGIETASDIEVIDMTDMDLDVVLARNAARTDKAPVPVPVIRRMAESIRSQGGYPLPVPEPDSAGKAPDFYLPRIDLFGAQEFDICDIDGTVASCEGIRSPYDYSRVSQDHGRQRVIEILRDRAFAGKGLIFMSGRPDVNNVREDTEDWLARIVRLPYAALYMRPADMQQVNDSVVKRHLFDTHVRAQYNLSGVVFDDRDRVVHMWRRQLGLDCMQVNYGNF